MMEQLNYNMLFRWFVDLSPDDPIWHPTHILRVCMVFMQNFQESKLGLYFDPNSKRYFVDTSLKHWQCYIFYPSAPHGVVKSISKKSHTLSHSNVE